MNVILLINEGQIHYILVYIPFYACPVSIVLSILPLLGRGNLTSEQNFVSLEEEWGTGPSTTIRVTV